MHFLSGKEFYDIIKWNRDYCQALSGRRRRRNCQSDYQKHDGRRGFIYHTTVSQEYRGQGIGKKLVDSAMKALEAEGIHKAALVAFEKNVSGNAFWEKAGFTVRDDLVYRNKNIHQIKRIDII